MIKRRSQTLAAWICLCDVLTVGAAWVGAYYLRFSGLFPIYKDQPPFEWCLHDMPLVMDLADRISVFHHGEILAEGPPAEIQNNPRVLEVYLKT